jgi:excisionase family DNA binding protein
VGTTNKRREPPARTRIKLLNGKINGTRYLGVLEVAAELGISRNHVWALIAARELPCIRVPSATGRRAGRVLIARSDLEAALRRWREDR